MQASIGVYHRKVGCLHCFANIHLLEGTDAGLVPAQLRHIFALCGRLSSLCCELAWQAYMGRITLIHSVNIYKRCL